MKLPCALRLAAVIQATAIILLIILSVAANAAYLTNMPHVITQPDATVINCFVSGDEFYNWIHDAGGYVIVQADNGWYVYATLVNDEIAPTEYVVGTVKPVDVGLTPDIKPSVQKLSARKASLFALPLGVDPQPAPRSGVINNVVIFIRFSDDAEYTDTGASYETVFNATTTGTSSMRNYFWESSYNKLTVNTTFYPTPAATVISFQDSHPRAYYLPYNATSNPTGYTESNATSREHTMLANAVNAVKSQIPSGLDVDSDEDGYVDNVCFIVKGGTSNWGTLLWPHAWALYSNNTTINGKRVWGYNLQFTSWLLPSGVGVLVHEMAHTLGAPDLYHYNSTPVDAVGSWDVMCGNANPPQYSGAYMKYKYMNWISSIPSISAPGTYTLNPLTSATNNCYKIAATGTTSEYYLVEYRKKSGTFENSLPGSGLIIYRINTAVSGNSDGPPDEVYIYRPNGTTTVNGSIGSAHYNSSVGRTAINNGTNPAGFLSSGSLGGLNISNIGAAGTTISFTVSFKLPNPTISPAGGTFAGPQTVTLTVPGGVGKVYYTTDGTSPDLNDPFVNSGGTIIISSSATLNAKAFFTGYSASDMVSATFNIMNMDISTMKRQPNGTQVGTDAAIVTAAFPNEFYIESDKRHIGILVVSSGHTLTKGMRVRVMGTMQTNANGERYIYASSAIQNGSGSLAPVATITRGMGGANWKYTEATGAGQKGTTGGKGLNTIGLLVRAIGKFRYIDATTFGLDSGSGDEVVCKMPSGLPIDPNWKLLTVTGISSCALSGSKVVPILRLRDINDLALSDGAMVTGTVTVSGSGVRNLVVESAHPYASDTDYTWTITGPVGATKMRAHFSQMQLETGYDKLYILDGAGVQNQVFDSSVTATNIWSNWITGNTIKLRLDTDLSVNNYGFRMDQYEVEAPSTAGVGITITLNPGNRTVITDSNGVYFFTGLPGGTYTLTPSNAGTTFTPANRGITLTSQQYMAGMDFSGL